MVDVYTKQEVLDLTRKYVDYVRSQVDISGAYLFGSYAKDLAREESDIDVAFITKGITGNRFNDGLEFMKMSRNYDVRIEPHLFSPEDFGTNNWFANEVLETGIRII
jgi:predicted nucleotidyltransferase